MNHNRRPKGLPKVRDNAIGNDMLNAANLPFAARLSVYSELLSANSVIKNRLSRIKEKRKSVV